MGPGSRAEAQEPEKENGGEVDLEEVYRRHKQAEYRKENLTPVAAELCRDSDGNWTKWVKERMTEEQEEKFNHMRRVLAELDPPLDYLSDNHVMRFLNSLLWEHEESLDYIKRAESMRIEYECTSLQ